MTLLNPSGTLKSGSASHYYSKAIIKFLSTKLEVSGSSKILF